MRRWSARSLRRVIGLLLALTVAAGCSWFSREEAPEWATPAPPPPQMEHVNTGDPAKTPAFLRIAISHYDVKNGWYMVPWEEFRLVAEVVGAENVTFYGFEPGKEPDPRTDGKVHRSLTDPSEADPDRWVVESEGNFAGPTMGIYAVAENQFGRTVSPVLFVHWQPRDGPYTAQDLREP